MLLKLILINLLPITLASPGFYSFGPQANDKTIDYSLEQSAIALDVPVVFMEKSVNEIFLSHNGIIGLGHRVPDKIVPLKDIANPTIAIYYAPVSSGKIHYRTTSSDRHLLNLLTAEIKQVFADASDFHALQTVIITWVEVENAEKDGQASFQIAIVTDGISTYSIVHYGQLPWSSSMGYYAQTGFVHSVGKVQTNVNSGGPDAKELVNLSNNKFGNSFIFRISGPAIEDPRDEGADDYDYNNYDQEYDNETPEDCPQDPYADNCPNECQTLRDERGCPRCICADRPAPRKPPRVPDLEQIRRDEEEEDSQRAEFHRQEDERHDQKSNHQHHQMQPSAEGRAQNMNNQQIQPSEQERPHHHHHHHHHHQHSEKLTCAQRDEKSCHTHSTCQDYDTGFCCQCESGYFGNGKECLPNGEPQRISGSFEGVINRIAIDRTDLHTFATPNDGNVYTAVSKIPSDIGHPLLLLNTIGSVMGWLFAEGNAPNGFQLTGGIFNRSATLHIGQKYYVTIKQEFSGRDIYDYFKSHLFVSGTLPDIAPGSTVVFPDYEEEYRRERPGLITSQAALDVVVRDGSATETIRMSVSQQIAYHECPHKSTEHDAPTRLQIRRINVVYNPDEGVVRYGSKNQIGANARQHGQSQVVSDEPINIPDDDVCATGRHQCTLPNMRCRAVEPSYRCECEPGYQAAHDSSSPIGWSCADLDECQRGDHNCDPYNGVCMNRHGSFECSCKEGFIGDGRTCTRVQAQEQENVETSAGSCTNHQQCHKWGECVFTADHPTGRCKCRGWYVGDGVNHCGPPERQEPAQPAQPAHQAHHHHHHHHHHQQQTPAVQACGTSICHKDAECMPEPGGGSECVCRAGFTGNGIHCESLVAEKQPQQPAIQQPEITGTVCRSHDQCSEHGSCAYSHSVGYYQCVCREPYVGNGVECHLPGDSSASDDETGCDVTNDCSEFADCVYERNAEGARFRCVCRSGYTGDGKYCMQSQLAINSAVPAVPAVPAVQMSCEPDCGENAQCVYDSHTKQFKCECYAAFLGDGYNCVPLAQPTSHEPSATPKTCVESSDCHHNGHCVINENGAGEYICECLAGFTGDGYHDCRASDECNPSHANACPSNSECSFDNNQNAYKCQCVSGFQQTASGCFPIPERISCQTEPRICHVNAQCVFRHETSNYECLCKPGSVGDGYNSCEVQDTPRCSNCSMNAYCAQTAAGSYQCKCNSGYIGNGYVCSAMTTCLDDRSLCDENAECVPGEGGHYVCNCNYGYQGDGRKCTPASTRANDKLLVARGMAIFERSTNPDEPGKQIIVIPHHIPVALDFDCKTDRIVWTDMSGHSIRMSTLNGTEQVSYFAKELSSPEGLAVDWSSRNVYYADSLNDEIGVASIDGKYKKSLITEGLVNPRSVVLDLFSRHVYYSDWHRENPYIGRMNMDGSDNQVFLNDDVHLPNALTILPNRREICWVDAGNHRLSCISLNGSGRRVVFSGLQYPFGLTHDEEAKFYWTDWKDNRIHSVGVYGDGYRSFPISRGGSGKVFGIMKIPSSCVGAATQCSNNNGGCEYLCLPSPSGTKCECPDNVEVKGCA